MHQLFSEPPAHPSLASGDGEECLRLPTLRFEVPDSAVPSWSELTIGAIGSAATRGSASGGQSRKRDRRAGEPHPSAPAAASLPAATIAEIKTFFEYGDQSQRPSDALRRLFMNRANPAALLSRDRAPTGLGGADSAAEQSSPVTQVNAATILALRQALAIICLLVRLDGAGSFLLTLPPAATPPPGTDTHQGSSHHGFLHLYCIMGGTALELEDLAAQLLVPAAGAGPDAARRTEETMKLMEEAHTRAAQLLDAFEATVVSVLLDEGRFVGHMTPSRGYIAQIVNSLPSAFREEAWPSRVVAFNSAEPEAAAAAAVSERRHSNVIPPAGTADGAALRDDLGQGTSAILLEAIAAVKAADCCYILSPGGARTQVPVTVTAARLLPKAGPSSGGAGGSRRRSGASHSRVEGIDLEAISLDEINARAWSGHYNSEGLCRADLEMRCLFFSLVVATVEAMGAGPKGGQRQRQLAAQLQQLQLLRQLWHDSLRSQYRRFLSNSGCGGGGSRDGATGELITGPAQDAFALARSFSPRSKDRSKVQQGALNVLSALRATDKDSWFAVPAFDMVNVDFSSLKCWVEGPTFAVKSGRAAFDALRRVLERMVDSCVQKYGPTHQFSVCIVAVRHQLVDAARREDLLS